MKINKVIVKNFKSIYDETTFDFQDTSGLWKISGDVGAGKTTIGETLLFGLFGTLKGKNNTNVISWGQKRCTIDIFCESMGRQLHINRVVNKYGQSPLNVTVNGEPLEFTNKLDAQNILENEYYDVSRTTVEMLCVISFNNFKSIATMNTADTKKFLDDVFNFYILTDYEKRCGVKYSNIVMANQTTKANIKVFTNQIKDYDNKISKLEVDNNNTLDKKNIEDQVKELRQQLKLSKLIQSHHIDTINKVNKSLNTQLVLTKQEGEIIKKNILLFKKGICPTCGSSLDTSNLSTLESDRLKLLEKYKNIESKEVKWSSIANNFIKYHSKLINDINSKISQLSIEYNNIKEQERILTENYKELREQAKKSLDQYEAIDTEEVKEMSEWSELGTILSKEMRSKLLKQFVPVINTNIQQYMTQLEQPYIVSFDETFNCMVSVYGTPDIPLSSLSTGQLKIVDCVISLGILKTIMNNVRFNICFMDELLSNMDYGLRNMMSDLLANIAKETNRTTYIITHSDIDDRYFRGNIEVYLRHQSETNNNSSYYKVTKKQKMD